jgi:hypothetical protein
MQRRFKIAERKIERPHSRRIKPGRKETGNETDATLPKENPAKD